MTEPTSPAAAGEVAPELLGYTTWFTDGCYHARFKTRLPQAALAAGCLEEVTADTGEELTAAAARNRIRISVWLTGQWADVQSAGERRARRRRP